MADVDERLISARAEALCNLWGDNPNDNRAWRAAIEHARREVVEGTWPADVDIAEVSRG